MSLKLKENHIEVLNTLLWANHLSRHPVEWVTPLDIGGTNGSHHSGTLNTLAKHGLVQFKARGASGNPPWGENGKRLFRSRGSKVYRITPDGRKRLEDLESSNA